MSGRGEWVYGCLGEKNEQEKTVSESIVCGSVNCKISIAFFERTRTNSTTQSYLRPLMPTCFTINQVDIPAHDCTLDKQRTADVP